MIYKFYRAQVTGSGYMPEGDCKATLSLDEKRNPTWSDVSEEFQTLCLTWFDSPVRMGVVGTPKPLTPYSDEALEHLSKHQLPSQGYMMVKVKAAPTTPAPFGHNQPPPGLFK